MKKITFLIALTISLFNANAQSVNFDWLKTADNNSSCSAKYTAVDAAGNVFVGGMYTSASLTLGTHTVDSVNGEHQAYLAKYDSEGAVLWMMDFPCMAYTNIYGLAHRWRWQCHYHWRI